MKCKGNVVLTIIAICLITTATHAQSGNLVLHFRVPFPFTAAMDSLRTQVLSAGRSTRCGLSRKVSPGSGTSF